MDMKTETGSENTKSGGRGGTLLAVALLVVHLLLVRFSGSVPSHGLLFVFFFSSLILVPGYFICRILFSGLRAPGLLFFMFVFGAAFDFMLLTVFAIFRLDLFYLGILVPVLSVGLSLVPRPRGRILPFPSVEIRLGK